MDVFSFALLEIIVSMFFMDVASVLPTTVIHTGLLLENGIVRRPTTDDRRVRLSKTTYDEQQ